MSYLLFCFTIPIEKPVENPLDTFLHMKKRPVDKLALSKAFLQVKYLV